VFLKRKIFRIIDIKIKSRVESYLGVSGNTLLLEAALVHAEPEVTVETPSGTPRVSDDPVRSGTLLTPTDNFDGMSSKFTTSGMSVDTRVI